MFEEYLPEVVQAVPGENYTVYAYFSDGKIVLYDVKPLIDKGGLFDRLKDPAFFSGQLTVLNHTVAWDLSGHFDPTTCIDLDPFVVYESRSVQDPLQSVG